MNSETFVIPVRFGVLVPNQDGVSKQTRFFYAQLLERLGLSSDEFKVTKTVLFSDEYKTSKASAAKAFEEMFNVVPSHNQLIIDIGGPSYKGCTDYSIVMGLLEALNNFASRLRLTIVMSNEVRYERDPEYAALVNAARKERILFGFAKEPFIGDWKSQFPREKEIYFKALKDLYSSFETPLLVRISKQIKRHPGYFRLQNGSQSFPFFYDFQDCINLAAEAIFSELLPRRDEILSGSVAVYFDGMHNDWFVASVGAATTALGLSSRTQRLDDPTTLQNFSDRSIVLVPLVRSGRALREILSNFVRPPEVWSFANVSADPEDEGSRVFKYSSTSGTEASVRLRWFKGLLDTNPAISKAWNAIKALPEDPKVVAMEPDFSSPAMWAMLLESGLDIEMYGPSKARELGEPIPNFSLMTERNLNLFADKFLMMAQASVDPGTFERMVYFCLDEPCARLISERISSPDNSKSLFISRSTLDELVAALRRAQSKSLAEISLDKLEIGQESKIEIGRLVQDISELQRVTRKSKKEVVQCIGLDEFFRSGTTIKDLTQAATFLGLEMRSHVSLALLADKTEAFEIPVKYLYHLPTE